MFGILTEGVDVPVSNEAMSIATLQEALPRENVNSISLPGTFSQMTATVILYATLPRQLRDGVR